MEPVLCQDNKGGERDEAMGSYNKLGGRGFSERGRGKRVDEALRLRKRDEIRIHKI